MALLKPPPERNSLERGALVGEGKDRYLQSLSKNSFLGEDLLFTFVFLEEKRLNRLQGSDKRKITSKDIMDSLSEAKESHMMQQSWDSPSCPSSRTQSSSGLSPPSQQTSSSRNLEPEPARNDPWSVPEHSAEASNTHQSDVSEFQPEEVFVDVRLKESGCGFMSCLTCVCFRRRLSGGRRRASGEGRRWRNSPGDESSSLTTEEERAYLMQCDQLGLASWGRDDSGD